MTRHIVFLILISFIGLSELNAQDLIIRKNGEKINCKITSVDSVNIYFTTEHNRVAVPTFLDKKEIETFHFAKIATVDTVPFIPDIISVGIGGGLDYGGFGLKVIGYPQKNVGLFIALGYAVAGAGFNAGVKVRLPGNNFQTLVPYGLAMYGYNTAMHIENAQHLDKFFYGPSFGLGFDLYPNRKKKNYWSLGVVFPIRSQEVDDYILDLKNNHGVTFKNSLNSVLVTIGINI